MSSVVPHTLLVHFFLSIMYDVFSFYLWSLDGTEFICTSFDLDPFSLSSVFQSNVQSTLYDLEQMTAPEFATAI
jgi:hypothetical protein